jgi:murein DD-endopeptidase MepM/ murein hydrolase activator NlpD
MHRSGFITIIALALTLTGCIPGNRPDPAPAPRPPMATPAPLLPPAAPPSPPAPAPAQPSWQARTVVPNAVEVASRNYVVVAGDSLRRISDKTGAASEAIARENRLAPPFKILIGQKLRIPGGRYHRVGEGESGIAIARAYGVDWSRVASMNLLTEPYVLREGQRLLLPSQAEVATMTLEERASAFRLDIDDVITGGEPALATNARPTRPVATATASVSPTVPVAEPARFSGRFDWPLTGPIVRRFGNLGGGRQNDGVNIGTVRGASIQAAADGVVAYVGNEIAGFGGLILIRHGDGWITAYGYAEELLVTRGQAVKRGQLIARAGVAGSAAEPQLHFQIREGRKPVNPLDHLPKRS